MAVLTTESTARLELHEKYAEEIQVNPALDRSLVSFQANKHEPFYGWFKYKEGFSSALVKYCLATLAEKPGILLDPFAGAGAALFASRELGWNAIGIEILPVGFFAMETRLAAERVKSDRFAEEVSRAGRESFAKYACQEFSFQHLRITGP